MIQHHSYTFAGFVFRLFALLVMTISLADIHVFAQETATLRILVISEDDGTPVIGAAVFISEPGADTLRAGVTNTDGFTEFSGLPARML